LFEETGVSSENHNIGIEPLKHKI